MTLLDDRPAGSADDDLPKLGEAGLLAGGPNLADDVTTAVDVPDEIIALVNPLTVALAALLSSAAAGWMLGGIFTGQGARGVGLLGALIGGGFAAIAARTRLGAIWQLLATPVAVAVGIALMSSSLGNGETVFSLIKEAIQAGGLSNPPVPFDPGWRPILIVLACALAIAGSAAAISFNRAPLAALVPAPVIVLAALLQPSSRDVSSITVSLALGIAALAVAYGATISRESVSGGNFEVRRLLRAGGLIIVIGAAIAGLSQLGFLYPPDNSSSVIPPHQPQTPPAVSNHLLFTATMPELTPLRTGVLDVYSGGAWLTPPYDPLRFITVTSGAILPAFENVKPANGATPVAGVKPVKTETVGITVSDLGEARQVPDIANPTSISNPPSGLQYDPRTQTLQTAERPSDGLKYTVVAAAPATSAELSKAGKAPAIVDGYLSVPTEPAIVANLISSIPSGLSTYERLQYVRNYYFQHAVASGPGNPVPVSPTRVAQILAGKPASPYEITAGEVLLARWSGVPARIGYGYYPSAANKTGVYPIYPSDGRMWLEAYFAGSGWVPILGHPAHATNDLDDHPKQPDKQILPNGQIQAQLYVPVRTPTLQFLYVEVQYWLTHLVLPLVLPLLFLWLLLPAFARGLRGLRRRRWASRFDPQTRIAVAYSQFRDLAIDFNAGHPTLTPLEFQTVTACDGEHEQLAWLVTRCLWGDLRRDVGEAEVEAAEALSRSVRRRFAGAQPLLLRTAAFASRASLREPYSSEIPNLWWSARISRLIGSPRRLARLSWTAVKNFRLAKLRLRPQAAAVVVLLLCVVALAGCGDQINLATDTVAASALPTVPATVDGYAFATEPSESQFAPYRSQALVANLGLYAIRHEGVAEATLQTAAFKQGISGTSPSIARDVINTLGAQPGVEIIGGQRIYDTTSNSLRLLIHFSADGKTYEILAADVKLTDPDKLFADLINQQTGTTGAVTRVAGNSTPPDVRRSL